MALPKIEDYKAPWELGPDGKPLAEEDQALDPAKLKKYVYGLLADKDRLQTTNATLTTERDTLQSTIDAEARKGESEADRLKRENADLQAKLAKSGETSIETLRLQVALENGLTAFQAKRLVGSTKEELEADAAELKTSWGGGGKVDDPEDTGVERTPVRRHNVLVPADDASSKLPAATPENINALFPF